MIKKSIFIALAVALGISPSSEAQSSMKALERAKTIVEDVRKAYSPDKRQDIFEITAFINPDGELTLGGKTTVAEMRDAVRAHMIATGDDWTDRMEVYGDSLWALPKLSVVNLRTAPGHGAELASQALMGMPVRVLESKGDWVRVQTPDGYIGWVADSSLSFKTAEEMNLWRESPRYVITETYQTRAYSGPDKSDVRNVVTDLVNGDIVQLTDNTSIINGRREVLLPDGRTGFVSADALTPIAEWAHQEFDPQKILDIAYSMEGTPYLWGGTSVKSLDCSGLAKVSYLANGIILMRDASQQATTGSRIEASDWRDCRAGDLLFFGNAKTGKVTHVAIYDHDGKYIHSSGRVKRNSVNPEDESYLTTPFLHATRIHGNENTPGIRLAKDHPWYFNQTTENQ